MVGEVRIDKTRKFWHDTFKSCAGFTAAIGGLAYLVGGDPTAGIIWTVVLLLVASRIKYKWVKTAQGDVWQRV